MEHRLAAGVGGVRNLLFDGDGVRLGVPVHDDVARAGVAKSATAKLPVSSIAREILDADFMGRILRGACPRLSGGLLTELAYPRRNVVKTR